MVDSEVAGLRQLAADYGNKAGVGLEDRLRQIAANYGNLVRDIAAAFPAISGGLRQ